MEYHPPLPVRPRVLVEVLDPPRVEGGGSADDAVHLVALGQEELGQVGAVLAGDASDEGHAAGAGLLAVGGRHGVGWEREKEKVGFRFVPSAMYWTRERSAGKSRRKKILC